MKVNIVITNPRRKPVPYVKQSTDANSLGKPKLLGKDESIEGYVLTINTDKFWLVLNDSSYRYIFDLKANLDIKVAYFGSKVSTKTKDETHP